MKKVHKTLEKALIMAVIAIVSISGKAFGQETIRHSPIFAEHYNSTNTLANDIENGKLKMSESVTELFFINYQLQSWNDELIRVGAKHENGSDYQLESEFEDLAQARKYFAKVLRNYCTDQDAVWTAGDYKLARAQVGKKDVVTLDWVRGPKPGEKITKLDPNTIPEISQSDGKFDLIDGFSLYCGNSMVKVKQTTPKPANRETRFVRVDTVYENLIVVLNRTNVSRNTTYYEPIPNPYDYQVSSMAGGVTPTNITYNVSNNGNTTNPAPIVMKNNNGAVVASVLIGTAMTAFAVWQGNRWQQLQPAQYYPVGSSWNQYVGWQNPIPTYPTVQGFAGQTVQYNPIQGNAFSGGNVQYNPIPNMYNSIQGSVWP